MCYLWIRQIGKLCVGHFGWSSDLDFKMVIQVLQDANWVSLAWLSVFNQPTVLFYENVFLFKIKKTYDYFLSKFPKTTVGIRLVFEFHPFQCWFIVWISLVSGNLYELRCFLGKVSSSTNYNLVLCAFELNIINSLSHHWYAPHLYDCSPVPAAE